MDKKKINQAIRIAKMYYELHYNQLEIAQKEGISKSSVSRILKSAMDMGVIEVRIKDSVFMESELEDALISRFPLLKRAVIVPDLVNNPQILMQDVCAALADDLPRYIKNNSVIGVTWGHVLGVLSKQLPKMKRKGVSVIQLTGGYSRAVFESGALDVLKNFVDSVGGTGYQIPAPAMVDKPFIVEALKQDSQIGEILRMAQVCQTAIFSVGNLERPSIVYEMGLIDEKDYRDFSKRGAVGDCCSHFINKDGEIFDEEIDARVVGASLETIKKIPNKLLIAVGKQKAKILAAALKGGLADSLYIDEPTAEEIVRSIPI
ncbi:MAG: winged helix-turn-helix transcriptional regulator [Eubacterium sp.]|nr:winged helix-turn-helix transcriptional regulator [Eubacterium sp.]MDD7209376.1 sugar-binding domain-containing protein [Lachnospiraceae bacterium]